MIESDEEQGRDLSRLVVARAGRIVTTGEAREPYRVIGSDGEIVEPVAVFLRDGQAAALAVLLSRDTWQQRWEASGAEDHPDSSWVQLPAQWLQENGLGASYDDNDLSSWLLILI